MLLVVIMSHSSVGTKTGSAWTRPLTMKQPKLTVLHQRLDLFPQRQRAELSHGEHVTGTHGLDARGRDNKIRRGTWEKYKHLTASYWMFFYLHFLFSQRRHEHGQIFTEKKTKIHQMNTHISQTDPPVFMGKRQKTLTVVFSPVLCFLRCPWPGSKDTGARAQNVRPKDESE